MKILLTGASSGIGKSLLALLSKDHLVTAPDRQQLDLSDIEQVKHFVNQPFDMLINCAGTGVGGKTEFAKHRYQDIQKILHVNLLGPIHLAHQILNTNPLAKIVNITSNNNKRYYANDLVYSLSKKALAEFGNMLQIEYPNTPVLEVRLGLTKTNFNKNRYLVEPERFQDIYAQLPYLKPEQVAKRIVDVLFDDHVKFIEISP